MKPIPCTSDAVAAVWAITSPSTIEDAPVLESSPGWKELRGRETWVYMRLTKAAARVLAEQLLHAASSDDPEVVTGRPQGAHSDGVSEEKFGFFLHPRGASLTIEVTDMAPIDALVEEDRTPSEPLSPQSGGRGFSR